MRRKSVMLATAMFVLALAAPAWALTVDFTAGEISGAGLTITAKTMGTINQSPFTQGTGASVYSGDMGNLGVAGKSYAGLGVGNDSSNGAITFKESLVFTFAQPQIVTKQILYGQTTYLTDLSFTLRGANTIYNTAGNVISPSDGVRLFIKPETGSVIQLDVNSGSFYLNGADPDTYEWKNWIMYALKYSGTYNGEAISAIAVEQIWGSATNPDRKFGVGSITYGAPVAVAAPEPLSLLLLGTGLFGLAGVRRFKK